MKTFLIIAAIVVGLVAVSFLSHNNENEVENMSDNNPKLKTVSTNLEEIENTIANLGDQDLQLKSNDFSQADLIILYAVDHSQEDKPKSIGLIQDKDTIMQIHQWLEPFPEEGDMRKKMAPSRVVDAYGFKGDELVAHITFHRHYLAALMGGFYGSGDDVLIENQKQILQVLNQNLQPAQ